MDSKHTPGPWSSTRASAAGYDVISADGPVDICVVSKRGKEPAEIDANARLIAAAPEMLEALKYARRFLKPEDHDTAYVDGVIAKATGQ